MKETLAQEIVKRYRKSDETFRKSYEGQAQKKKNPLCSGHLNL